MLNPKLNVGDRVRLLYMEGEPLLPNTWGTVKSVYELFGSTDYSVVWDDGDKDNVGERISQLNLISDKYINNGVTNMAMSIKSYEL